MSNTTLITYLLGDAEEDEGEVEENGPEGRDLLGAEDREGRRHELGGQPQHLVAGLEARLDPGPGDPLAHEERGVRHEALGRARVGRGGRLVVGPQKRVARYSFCWQGEESIVGTAFDC